MNCFISDYCIRCCTPFHDNQMTYLVSGGLDAKYRELAIEVCRKCLQEPSFDVIQALEVTKYPKGNNPPWRPPSYRGEANTPHGWTYYHTLDNGFYRLPLHRGHVEYRTELPIHPPGMAYTEGYGLYGPVSLFKSEAVLHRILSSSLIDLSAPSQKLSIGNMKPWASISHEDALIFRQALKERLKVDVLGLRTLIPVDYLGNFKVDRAFHIIGEALESVPMFVDEPALTLVLEQSQKYPGGVSFVSHFPAAKGTVMFSHFLSPLYTGGSLLWRGFTWSLQINHVVIGLIYDFGQRWMLGGYLEFPLGRDILGPLDWAGSEQQSIEKRRIILTLNAFIDQKLLIAVERQLPRAARHRLAAQAIDSGGTRELILRSIQYQHHNGGHKEVDWACRWIVRGHWRNQWYRSIPGHKAILILPHVKGPENKPLRMPRNTVVIVRR